MEREMHMQQQQAMVLSPQMRQGLEVLQLPLVELQEMVELEIERNPMLRREGEGAAALIPEESVAASVGSFESLMQQAHELIDEKDLPMAEAIIGSLNSRGILDTPLEELAFGKQDLERVLQQVQTLSPVGVGARSLQEQLLIQLRTEKESLPYKIVEQCWPLLLKNRFSDISEALSSTIKEVKRAIVRLSHYNLSFADEEVIPLIPDVTLLEDGSEWVIEIHGEILPSLSIDSQYLQMLDQADLPKETRSYLRERLASCKQLLNNIDQRQRTLRRLTEALLEVQGAYFRGDEPLKPLTMQMVADELSLHPSTVARAVAHKTLACPRGMIPLRSLFTTSYTLDNGETISSSTIKERVQQLIGAEEAPLSDAKLEALLSGEGIHCSRRTIAKYRNELGIPPSTRR